MAKQEVIKSDYRRWLQELKQRIRQGKLKAAVRINAALLELYWSIGADIVNRQIEKEWGSGVITQLSADLRAEFPDMQGFSTANLWYIKKWYLFYSQDDTKLPQVVGEIPWGHNREIITKFLLELGTGFAYVGRQVEIVVSNTSYFIDMLFYHIKLKCYVVVELKTVKFEPEFTGKLNFYVTAADRQLRGKADNTTWQNRR